MTLGKKNTKDANKNTKRLRVEKPPLRIKVIGFSYSDLRQQEVKVKSFISETKGEHSKFMRAYKAFRLTMSTNASDSTLVS
jgi:hypothetical protein